MKLLKMIFLLFLFKLCLSESNSFSIQYEKTFGNSGGIPGPSFDAKKGEFYGGSPDSEGVIAIYLGVGFFAFDETTGKIYCNTRSDNFYEIDSNSGIVLKAKTLGPGWHYSSTGLACDENYLYSIHGNSIQIFSKDTLEYKGEFIKIPSPRKILVAENTLYIQHFENGKFYLKKYNTETKELIPFQSQVSVNGGDMIIDSKGKLWTIWDAKTIHIYDAKTGGKISSLDLKKDLINPKPAKFGAIYIRNNFLYIWDRKFIYCYPVDNLMNGKIVAGGGNEVLNSFPERGYGEYMQLYVDKKGAIYVSFGVTPRFIAKYLPEDGGKQYPVWYINLMGGNGMDIDPDGNLWAAVTLFGAVKYDGKTTVPIAQINAGGYNTDLVCDDKGNKYMCAPYDGWTSSIVAITPDNKISSSERVEKSTFTGIAMDEFFLYVSNNRGCISKFIKDIPPEWQQDILPEGITLNKPGGIEVDDKFLYISDTENKRIIKFEKYSPFKVHWIVKDFFDQPTDLSLYGNYLFVCDPNKHRIVVINKEDGSYLGEIGSYGKHGDKEITRKFNSPRYLKVKEIKGQVYLFVSDILQGIRKYKINISETK